MQDLIIIDSDYEELELFSGDQVAPEIIAFSVGPKGEPGLVGDITPEAEAALLEIRDHRQDIDLAAEDARNSKQAAALSEQNAGTFANQAQGGAESALASKQAAGNSELNAAESRTQAGQANSAAQLAKIDVINARDETLGARDVTLLARDQAQQAAGAADAAREASVAARNDAQTARGQAVSARDDAAGYAEAASASAQAASTFDPALFVRRDSNGSTFANPAQVRANIGAQEVLTAVSNAEITAGVSVEARLWSADAVRRAAVYFAGTVQHQISDVIGLGDALTDISTDISALSTTMATKASLASPALTGTPTAPTAALTTDNDQLATTSFVWSVYRQLTDGADQAFDTFREIQDWIVQHGQEAADIVAQLGTKASINHTHAILDIDGLRSELDGLATGVAQRAPLNSPVLTGTPTAPTPLASDNSQRIATTAQVQAAIAAAGLASEGHTHVAAEITDLQPLLDDKANEGHVHEIADVNGLQTALGEKAPLASPALTGNPTAPTQATGDNSTRVANTAFVATAVANGVADKANVVHPHSISDVNNLQTALDAKAPLVSPGLTGTPTAPTADPGANSTQIANAAFVAAAIATRAKAPTVSTVNPTSADGVDGDVWYVV